MNSDTSTPAAKVFVSYSRRDLSFATRLAAALEQQGVSVWVDLEDIAPSDDWLDAIHAAIEGADAIVFIVSPDSVSTASVCAREVEHALRHNKRLIPVVCRPVDTRTTPVPEAVGRLNWVGFLDEAGFHASVATLIAAIATDLEWLKSHTRLVQGAVEWDAARRDDSLLLRKNMLSAAERWLALAPAKDPKPTGLQTEYILASRAEETRVQRRRLVIAGIACLLIGVGATVAAFQHAQAEQRRKEATSRENAAEARFERGRRLDRAILLSASALDTLPTYDALDAAVAVGQSSFGVERVLRGPAGPVTGLCFMSGNRLVSAHQDGRWVLWNLATASPLLSVAMPKRAAVRALACDAASGRVAASSADGALAIWQLDAAHAVQLLEADAPMDQLRFAAGGALLVGGANGTLVLRRAADWRREESFAIGRRNVAALAVSAAGDLVAVGTFGSHDEGGAVSLWRTADHQMLFEQAPFAQGVADVALREGGTRVVATGVGGGVFEWARDGTPIELAPTESGLDNAGLLARFDPTGTRVALSAGNGLAVATIEAQPTVHRLAGHAGPVTQAAFDAPGGRVASASADGVVIVHRLAGQDERDGGWEVTGPDDAADDIGFSAAGDALVYQPPSGPQRRIELPAAVRQLGAHDAGDRLAAPPRARFHAVAADSRATLLRAGSDQPVSEMIPEPGSAVLATAVAENGSRWAGASGSAVRIAGVAEGRSTPAILPSGFGDISALAISPDGGVVAVAGADLLQGNAAEAGMALRRLVLLDGETGRPLGETIKMTWPVLTLRLVFSADGQLLASVDQSSVTVWLAAPQLWRQRSCALLDTGASAADWQRVLPDVARPDGCDNLAKSR